MNRLHRKRTSEKHARRERRAMRKLQGEQLRRINDSPRFPAWVRRAARVKARRWFVEPVEAAHGGRGIPTCLHLWQPLGDDPFPDPLGERADRVGPRPGEVDAGVRVFIRAKERRRA